MKNIILGTAGHIDHGKTTLINALTGRQTDRLKEEQERGISIELGFTYFNLSDGTKAGIIDVPGHEKFIKSMLAGITGIDIVLLIIASDEGIMPQTKEHLDILNLLGLDRGIIVLTKCGLTDDEWRELVKEDIMETVEGTFLENADIVEVDSVSKSGIPELKEKIEKMVEETENRKVYGNPKLPVDRVFTISGFGTVVTGTLVSGSFSTGDQIRIYPKDIEGKIRNLQVHGNDVEKAFAGQRVAINISGVKKNDIERGDVIALTDSMESTMMLDVKLKLLEDSQRIIENRTRLRLYIGSKEVLCRVVILDKENLTPGEECFAQLRLEERIAASKGDRFIIRFYSPMMTIGGGEVLDPNPTKKKRFDSEAIEALEIKSRGDQSEVIENIIGKNSDKYPTIKDLSVMTSNTIEELEEYLSELEENNLVRIFSLSKEKYIIHIDYLSKLGEKISEEIEKYHKKYPFRNGISKEEIRSRYLSKAKPRLGEQIISYISEQRDIVQIDDKLQKSEFKIEFLGEDKDLKELIEKEYQSSSFIILKREDLIKNLSKKYNREKIEQIFESLIELGNIIKMKDDVYIHKEAFDKAVSMIKEYIIDKGSITVGETRDILNTNRKMALAIIEELDERKITKRVEDKRFLS
ncbi:MAG: selenocysteine-specific translation elongation factor [Andreesenia angusta]|nr:selenocysteine-specific translation elongation factor [Andreesenia angusta]